MSQTRQCKELSLSKRQLQKIENEINWGILQFSIVRKTKEIQDCIWNLQRLLDSVGLNNTLSIQLRLAGVQRDWINSLDEDDLWDWNS